MPAIEAGELLHKRSVKTESAGNPTAQADPDASLGKCVSTTLSNDGVTIAAVGDTGSL